MTRTARFASLLALLVCSPVAAQEWATRMFEATSHDYGTLAKGAKAEFRFMLKNIYVEDVHITDVRSSCGCTQVRIEKPHLKTYEKGAIVATINTVQFEGRRGATLTVTLDKPFPAQVQLHTACYIRSDVVFQPGSVQFGSVDQGRKAETTVALAYAGRSDWRILEVKSANPHLTAKAVETVRSGGQIGYNLVVQLGPQAPAGYLNDHLVLMTNDYQLTQVPLAVEGRIEAAITVTPGTLFLGVLHPGEKVTKQLVIRGKKPFRVLSITSDGENLEFDASAEKDAKLLHMIPVTFKAGDDPGKISHKIRIITDAGDTQPQLSAVAVVAP